MVIVYNSKSVPVPAHKCRVGCVKCADTVTPQLNRFPAGTLRYQETELIYILSKVLGASNLLLARVIVDSVDRLCITSCIRYSCPRGRI